MNAPTLTEDIARALLETVAELLDVPTDVVVSMSPAELRATSAAVSATHSAMRSALQRRLASERSAP